MVYWKVCARYNAVTIDAKDWEQPINMTRGFITNPEHKLRPPNQTKKPFKYNETSLKDNFENDVLSLLRKTELELELELELKRQSANENTKKMMFL